MNFIHTLFFLQLIVFFGVMLARAFNVFSVGRLFDVRVSMLLLFVTLIAYFFGLVCVMMDLEVLYLSVFFRFESWFLVLNVVLFFAELAFFMKSVAVGPIKAYRSKDDRGS